MMIRMTKIRMATPANREARNRLADMDWLTSPQNLLTWADKGAIQLNRLIPALKKVALCEGANINVDETCVVSGQQEGTHRDILLRGH